MSDAAQPKAATPTEAVNVSSDEGVSGSPAYPIERETPRSRLAALRLKWGRKKTADETGSGAATPVEGAEKMAKTDDTLDDKVDSKKDIPNDTPKAPYSTLSLSYRWYLTILLGYLCLASSLTANLYFPLIQLLAEWYRVSESEINLTITLYLVVQAITPAIFSALSDSYGRRPVLLFNFSLYTGASIGLYFSGHSYGVLLALRMLQSAGGSALLSIAYAIIADFTVNSEKGKFTAPMMTTTNLGTCIGPVIGGSVLLATSDPRDCFLALVVFGGLATLLVGLSLPETNRSIVGNGAVPVSGIWRTWWDFLPINKTKNLLKKTPSHVENNAADPSSHPDNAAATGRGNIAFPNPWHSVRLIFNKDLGTVLALAASPYGAWYCVPAGIPFIYGDQYHWNPLHVGLSYLAGGTGIIVGGLINAKLPDWNYAVVARRHGLTVDRRVGDAVHTFPIEEARTRGVPFFLALGLACFVGLGWSVRFSAHPAVSLVFQFLLGARCTVLHQIFSALLIEVATPLQAGRNVAATLGGSNNICRCALAALFVGILKPALDALGYGWFFTMIGLADFVVSIACVYIIRRWGWEWRRKRSQRWLENPPAFLR